MKDHFRSVFRDDSQVAEVCNLLCEHASMPGMWTVGYGPTSECERILSRDCAGLTAGQQVIFLVAWELWNEERVDKQSHIVRFAFVVRVLTGKYLMPLATLLVAMGGGPEAVDDWLSSNRLPYPK
jgi:hypothetical protein